MLLDTNVWLLGLTAAVSMLHMVFDFLAFKNGTIFVDVLIRRHSF